MDFDLDYIKSIMSKTDLKSLNLADTQLFALLILLMGSLVLINSATQNRELILRKYVDFGTPAPDPLQTAIYGSKINVSALILLVYVAFVRQSDTDIAYSSGLINNNLYQPSTNLTKISMIGLIITSLSLFSITQLSKSQAPTEPVQEEEFVF